MPLINPFMVKQVYGNTDLTLEAKTGESLLVKDILVFNPASSYATLKIEKATVGYFRVGGNLGNHLPLPIGSVKHSHGVTEAGADGSLTQDHAVTDAFGVSNASLAVFSDTSSATTHANAIDFGSIPALGYLTLLKYLAKKEIFTGYPIAEGETLTITGVKQSGALQLVIYEKYDAGDIVNTDMNGSASTKYMFINYGRVAAAITTSASTLFDTVQTPAEFPDFPIGKVCPAKSKFTIYGLLASDIVDDRGSNDTMNSDYIKLVLGRETLFDDDRNGVFMKGVIGTTDGTAQIGRGLSLIGNLSDVDIKPPLMFPTPLEFSEGEELNIYITTTAGASQSASDLAAADTEIGVICVVERLA